MKPVSLKTLALTFVLGVSCNDKNPATDADIEAANQAIDSQAELIKDGLDEEKIAVGVAAQEALRQADLDVAVNKANIEADKIAAQAQLDADKKRADAEAVAQKAKIDAAIKKADADADAEKPNVDSEQL